MTVGNNNDDVLSKGYPVSKMLIVLSTVFICQDSQRACIHFVCSNQMGSLTACVCDDFSFVLKCAFIYAYAVCLWCAHVSMRLCVPTDTSPDQQHLHVFTGRDPFIQRKNFRVN